VVSELEIIFCVFSAGNNLVNSLIPFIGVMKGGGTGERSNTILKQIYQVWFKLILSG
jgi:hypothetical protein